MTDPLLGVTGIQWHAGALWELAEALALRIERDATHGGKAIAASLSVLLFAAVAVETFVNELTQIAQAAAQRGDQAIAGLGAALSALESKRRGTREKLRALGEACGQPFDKKVEPYRSFDLLFSVRDGIVHGKPHRHTYAAKGIIIEGPLADLLAALWNRGLINDPSGRPMQGTLELLADPRLCRWSVETARAVIRRAVGILPAGAGRTRARRSVRNLPTKQRSGIHS